MSSQDVEESKLGNQVNLSHATQTMNTNPIKTAMDVCSKLIQRKVSVMNKTVQSMHRKAQTSRRKLVIVAITGSKNKHSIESGRDWTT